MSTPIDANMLLSILGSGVRPVDPVPSSASNGVRFEDSLRRAGYGASGSAPVTSLPGVDHGLNVDQLASLADVADQAERAGHSTLGVVHGDRVLTIDLASRTITGVSALGDGPVPGADALAAMPEEPARSIPGPGVVASLGPLKAELGLDAPGLNNSLLAALTRGLR